MHLEKKAQVGVLIFNKVFVVVLAEYFNYSKVFSVKNTAKLSKYFKMNNYPIKLEVNKQPAFRPIYNLEPVKLEILKMYIRPA